MCSRNWGIELWDRINDVMSYTNHSISQVDLFYKLCDGYRKSQAAHAKRLRKLIKNHIADNVFLSSHSTNNSEHYSAQLATLLHQNTFIEAQRLFLNGLEEEVTHCSRLAEELESKVTQSLWKDVEYFKKTWRDNQEQLTHLHDQYNQQKNQFESYLRRYQEAYKESQRVEENLSRVSESKNMTPQDMTKQRNLADSRRAILDRRRGEYFKALEQMNHRQLQFYTNDLADWSMSQMTLHDRRYHVMKEKISEVRDILQTFHTGLSEKQNHLLHQSFDQLDSRKDGEQVVNILRTGSVFPCDLPVINLEWKSTSDGRNSISQQSTATTMDYGPSTNTLSSFNSSSSHGHESDTLDVSRVSDASGPKNQTPRMSGNSRFRRSSLGRLSHKVRKGFTQLSATLSGSSAATEPAQQPLPTSTPKIGRTAEVGQSIQSIVSSSTSSSSNAENPPNKVVQNVRQRLASATDTIRQSRSRFKPSIPTSTPIESRTLRTLSQTRQTTFMFKRNTQSQLDDVSLSVEGHKKYVESLNKVLSQTEAILLAATKHLETYSEGSQPYLDAQHTVKLCQCKLISLASVKERHENLLQRIEAAREHFRRQSASELKPPSASVHEFSSTSGSSSSWSSSSSFDSHDNSVTQTSHTTSSSKTTTSNTSRSVNQKSSKSNSEASATQNVTAIDHVDNGPPIGPIQAPYGLCVAIGDFTGAANHPQCLSFKAQDVFQILLPDSGHGWTYVSSLDGSRKGIIPTNYMQVIENSLPTNEVEL